MVPAGLLQPRLATTDREVVAAAFTDGDAIVLLVVNGSERRLRTRVSLGELASGSLVAADGAGPAVLSEGVLTLGLEAFEARVVRVGP